MYLDKVGRWLEIAQYAILSVGVVICIIAYFTTPALDPPPGLAALMSGDVEWPSAGDFAVAAVVLVGELAPLAALFLVAVFAADDATEEQE